MVKIYYRGPGGVKQKAEPATLFRVRNGGNSLENLPSESSKTASWERLPLAWLYDSYQPEARARSWPKTSLAVRVSVKKSRRAGSRPAPCDFPEKAARCSLALLLDRAFLQDDLRRHAVLVSDVDQPAGLQAV